MSDNPAVTPETAREHLTLSDIDDDKDAGLVKQVWTLARWCPGATVDNSTEDIDKNSEENNALQTGQLQVQVKSLTESGNLVNLILYQTDSVIIGKK